MSIAVPRGPWSRSLRSASLCHSCAAQRSRFIDRAAPRKRTAAAFATTARRNVHPWRRQVVSALNEKDQDVMIPKSSPGRRDGILKPEVYSEEPMFMPIDLDVIPVAKDGEEGRSTSLESTRPPSFEAPRRLASDTLLSYLLKTGKTYWAFYKTGLKNLLANRKDMKEIQAWIHPFSLPAAARYGGLMHKTKQDNDVPIPYITHRDFQLYHRTRADLRKLIPFGLLLLICGEFTPIALVVLGRRAVPKVCYLPGQQREEIDDAVDRFRLWKTEMAKLTAGNTPEHPAHQLDFTPKTGRLEHPWRRDLLFAYMVGLTNFYRLPFPITRGLYWHFILNGRITRYLENIFCDTILIRREGGFEAMSPQDVYEYAKNYGLLTLYIIMERQVANKRYDFVNETLKRTLVPILEAEADLMLQDDFTRLTPNLHWAKAYRDTARWVDSPDVRYAAQLMQKYEAEDKLATAKTAKAKTAT